MTKSKNLLLILIIFLTAIVVVIAMQFFKKAQPTEVTPQKPKEQLTEKEQKSKDEIVSLTKVAPIQPPTTEPPYTILYNQKTDTFTVLIHKNPYEEHRTTVVEWFKKHDLDPCKLEILWIKSSREVENYDNPDDQGTTTPGC